MNVEGNRWNRARRRLAGWGTGVGTLAIVLVMAASPATAAGSHSYRPPYTTSAGAVYQVLGGGACGTAAAIGAVNWSSTTGVATAGGKTSAKGCPVQVGGVGGSSYGEYEAEIDVGVPIKIASTGLHSIVVNWKINAATASSYTPGTCYLGANSTGVWYCESLAYWEVFAEASIVDQTNNTVFYGNNSFDAYNESYNQTEWVFGTYYNGSGSFGFGSFGSAALYINASLVKGHSYAVVTYIEVISEAALEAYNAAVKGGSASSSANMATGPNKATLTSIVVS